MKGTPVTGSSDARPDYVAPTLRILNEDEVLAAFQMTAAKISAAGCWWGACEPQGS
jgi:hypothetical protein